MPPNITARQLLSKMKRVGFVVIRQRGSHVFVQHATDSSRCAVIPLHGNSSIPIGTLKSILQSTNLTLDDLNKM
jgi:predicted RNA binding protein YcfA (HicA-like mRNA interferase family)